MAACRAHMCLESFINTLKHHVARHKRTYSVDTSHNSLSFSAKLDCSSSANTRIFQLAQYIIRSQTWFR